MYRFAFFRFLVASSRRLFDPLWNKSSKGGEKKSHTCSQPAELTDVIYSTHVNLPWVMQVNVGVHKGGQRQHQNCHFHFFAEVVGRNCHKVVSDPAPENLTNWGNSRRRSVKFDPERTHACGTMGQICTATRYAHTQAPPFYFHIRPSASLIGIDVTAATIYTIV